MTIHMLAQSKSIALSVVEYSIFIYPRLLRAQPDQPSPRQSDT